MKLYNKTKISDKVLERLLYRSAKAVGSVRTQKVVVKVTASKTSYGHVSMGTGGFYYEWALRGQSWETGSEKAICSDGGFMFLKIAISDYHQDPLDFADRVYRLAAHEWRHIRDYQKHVRFDTHRKRWANRSHEKRAMNSARKATREIDKRGDIQDAILNVALEAEAIWKDKKDAWDKRWAEAKKRQLTSKQKNVRMISIPSAQ